jgi:hypothetical protein
MHRLRLTWKGYKGLMERARSVGAAPQVCRLGADVYGASHNYDTADYTYANFVEDYLDDYDAAALGHLLGKIEGNRQTYDRGQATWAHPRILTRCRAVLPADFDYSLFPGFMGSIPPGS